MRRREYASFLPANTLDDAQARAPVEYDRARVEIGADLRPRLRAVALIGRTRGGVMVSRRMMSTPAATCFLACAGVPMSAATLTPCACAFSITSGGCVPSFRLGL